LPCCTMYRKCVDSSADGVTYYYSVNIQGDVMAILDENGTIMVHYIRQGYGLGYYIVPSNATGSMLNKLNPFGYRGYVRDRETYLYYLESRYYSEDLCRFLNADAYTSTGQGLLGNNMFAYCLNNPTNYIDTSGRLAGLLRDICRWIDDNVIQPVVEFVEDVYEDIKNYDLNNQSEDKVLESNYFSCYKGVLVIRTNGERSGSFGVIFLTRE